MMKDFVRGYSLHLVLLVVRNYLVFNSRGREGASLPGVIGTFGRVSVIAFPLKDYWYSQVTTFEVFFSLL